MADVLQTNSFDRAYQKPGNSTDIGYYEERLSKRREKEKEDKKLNEFLHNSLRASDRLKSLEKGKRSNFKVNVGYLEEGWEDEGPIDVAALTDVLCSRKNIKTVPTSDLLWLKQFVKRDLFQASYYTCTAVSQILNRHNCPPLSGSPEASSYLFEAADHINEVHKGLKHSQYKSQMRELLQILSYPEIQTLCEANDACAKIQDQNKEFHRGTNRMDPLVDGVSVDVTRRPKKGDNGSKEASRTPEKSKSLQASIQMIQSPLQGCYAQLHPSEKGIPIKTVVLEKNSMPLGATVRNERDAVVVGRIVVGGVAHKSGLLKEGDELLSVNGIDLTGKDVNEVSDILAKMNGTLKFVVASVDESTSLSVYQPQPTTKIHLRSLYTYNPQDDAYIPCKDIGLNFERGDILHVTNTQDPNWWQAYRDIEGVGEGSLGELAGLIPSPDYQYQREMLRKQLGGCNDSMNMYGSTRQESSILCLKKPKKNYPATVNGGWVYNVDINGRASNVDYNVAGRKRKHNKKGNRSTYCPGEMELNQPDPNINTYEEVQKFLPQPHRKRPIVLVGPEQIGRNELVKMIITSDGEQFCLVKQHTTLETRSPDYHQVTKEEFKHLLNQEEFLETATFEKNWYGTSKSDVKAVIDSGKTAVFVLQPESLHVIRKTTFLPYVIFVSPPTKIEAHRRLRIDLYGQRPADEDLMTTNDHAKYINEKFGHMFDIMLMINTLEEALATALKTIGRLDSDPQWVPSRWILQRPGSHMP